MVYFSMTRLAAPLLIFSIILAICMPFFNRTLVRFSPYPFFNSLFLTIVSIPLSMTLAWLTRGSQFLSSWTIPSSKTCLHITIASVFYAASVVLCQFCYLYSTFDLTVTSSFLAVVATVFFAQFCFRDPNSNKGILSLLVVFAGLVITFFTFTSNGLDPSVQICLQIGFALCLAAANVSVRKLIEVVSVFETLPVSFVNMWIHLIGAIPLFIVFLFEEAQTIPKLAGVFTLDFLTLILFGVTTMELFSVCTAVLRECTGYGFAEHVVPLNCLPALLISYSWYNESDYGTGQPIGLLFVHVGYAVYSLGRAKPERSPPPAEGDSLPFLFAEDREKTVEGV
jgi:hypothetical protein